MISTQIVQDPIWNYTAAEDQMGLGLPEYNEPSSSSSSESSSTDTDNEVCASELEGDAVSQPRRWDPDTEMYRNKKSLVVHVLAVGGADSFSCGIRISSDYEKIQETPFWRFANVEDASKRSPSKRWDSSLLH